MFEISMDSTTGLVKSATPIRLWTVFPRGEGVVGADIAEAASVAVASQKISQLMRFTNSGSSRPRCSLKGALREGH